MDYRLGMVVLAVGGLLSLLLIHLSEWVLNREFWACAMAVCSVVLVMLVCNIYFYARRLARTGEEANG